MLEQAEQKERIAVVTWSTIAFTLLFAVWLMFGVLSIPIQKEFNLTETQLGWLASIAILNGSIWRLPFGILADKYGGKKIFIGIMFVTAIFSYLVSYAETYSQLLFYAFIIGFAGNAFSVGISWNSAWFPKKDQGFALGIFGAGNVGASVTKLIAPTLIILLPVAGYFNGFIPGGWRFIPVLYAVLLIVCTICVFLFTPTRHSIPTASVTFLQALVPLKEIRVWRFSLYYVAVFGAYVALSIWLPRYYVDVYKLDLKTAALLTALFIFPASLLRPLGGKLSDIFGPRPVMYSVFGLMSVCLIFLGAPHGHIVLYVSEKYIASGQMDVMKFTLGVVPFTVLIFIVGVCMGIGKASVYKYIPEYFPNHVGAVGGLVGCLGALGGFILPVLFTYSSVYTGIPQTCFMIVALVTISSLIWLNLTIIKMTNKFAPHSKLKIDRSDDT